MNYEDFLKLSEEEKRKLNISDSHEKEKMEFDCRNTRKSNYPTTDEWMRALIQKEVDGQPEEWNNLIRRRNHIKSKYPKLN